MSSSNSESRRNRPQRDTDRTQMNGLGEWSDAQLADWLSNQIVAYDAGTLPAEWADRIGEVCPEWLSEDTRFHYGLFMDWTQPRLAAYLTAKLSAFDAGTLTPAEVEGMNRTMPDWLTADARAFCGLAPISE